MPGLNPEADAEHWRKTRNLTLFILAIWAIFAFVVHVFAEWLNQYTFIGFPLGYYLAVQGSLIVFVLTFEATTRIPVGSGSSSRSSSPLESE